MKKLRYVPIIALLFIFLMPLPVKAFSIQSYITNPTSIEAYGYDKITYNNVHKLNFYTYKNTYPNSSDVTIWRNSVKSGNSLYDLVLYPFAIDTDAYIRMDATGITVIGEGMIGVKIAVTKHVDYGIGETINWTGMVGFADLDDVEYVILPERINTGSPFSHVGRYVRESYVPGRGWKYLGTVNVGDEIGGYDYGSVFTQTTIPASGYIFYYGLDEYTTRGTSLAIDAMKQYVENTWPQYQVTYIDVEDSTNGRVLGTHTKYAGYTDTIRGFDMGSSTEDNAYYKNYYLESDTSAQVNGNGVVVYRIFKQCLFDITGSVTWNDREDKLDMRPEETTLNLYQNGELFKEFIIDGSTQSSYVFEDLKVYDPSGNPYTYTVQESFYSKYWYDGQFIDAYVINQNGYDFLNTLQFNKGDIVPDYKHHTDIVMTTNTEEKIPVTLTRLETFIDEDLNISHGEATGEEIKVFVDNLGEIINSIPAGKYEVNISGDYTLEDIVINNNNHVFMEKKQRRWYLVVEPAYEDGFANINIALLKTEELYKAIRKINNYFSI